MIASPPESLPPPPHAETAAANISMMPFNERFFITFSCYSCIIPITYSCMGCDHSQVVFLPQKLRINGYFL
jgi:hypothetical protein